MIKMAIAGAAGRMGKTLIKCASGIDTIEITATIENTGNQAIGLDAGVVAGIDDIGVLITNNGDVINNADVVIDFTFHTVVPDNVGRAVNAGKAIVIGTTGLDEIETNIVKQAAKKIPIVWAPNMSLGVNLLFATVKKAVSVFGSNYVIEIDETHHIHKKDAPSGTALKLGEKVAEGSCLNFKDAIIHKPEGAIGDCTDNNKITIYSHRKDEVVGDHTVSFSNNGERVEFTHHAWSRDAFAMGALHAAQWVVNHKPGLYDMQDVLGLQ